MSHPPDHIPELDSPRQSRSPLKKDKKEQVSSKPRDPFSNDSHGKSLKKIIQFPCLQQTDSSFDKMSQIEIMLQTIFPALSQPDIDINIKNQLASTIDHCLDSCRAQLRTTQYSRLCFPFPFVNN